MTKIPGNREWIQVSEKKPDPPEPVFCARERNGKWQIGITYWCEVMGWLPSMVSEDNPDGFTHWAEIDGWIPVSEKKPDTLAPIRYARREKGGGWKTGIAVWIDDQKKWRPAGFTHWSPL